MLFGRAHYNKNKNVQHSRRHYFPSVDLPISINYNINNNMMDKCTQIRRHVGTARLNNTIYPSHPYR